MGNAQKPKKESNEIETLLTNTYKTTDLEFNFKEVLSFKLRIKDAEHYFYSKFDFFFYFNNYLFRERISILYDNFNAQIEHFSAKKNKESFKVLIDFDDEAENIARGSKIDFDSLFTIACEKLEISIILFFDMTNLTSAYIQDFFLQLVESVDLYKYNRKFDCLYFLLPNTDYVIKNDCAFLYLTHKIIPNKKIFFNDEILDINNDFSKAIFTKLNSDKLTSSIYPKVEGNNYLEYFIEKCKPTVIKTFMNFNFACELESFILINEDQFKTFEFLVQSCQVNIVILNDVYFTCEKVFQLFFKKILNLFDKSGVSESVLVLKCFVNRSKFTNFTEMSFKLYLNKLINDLSDENISTANRRKFILNVYEYTLIPMIHSNRENKEGENSVMKNEIVYDCTSYFLYWNIPTNKKEISKTKFCLGTLVNTSKYSKLKNKNIINNIKEYLFSNFTHKVTRYAKRITEDELINE